MKYIRWENKTFLLHVLPDREWKLEKVTDNAAIDAYDAGSEDLLRYLQEYTYYHCIPGITDLQLWCATMTVLQIAALLLLTFENSSLVDENNVIRYISDNIADHRGYGSMMVLAFMGSLGLLSCMMLKNTYTRRHTSRSDLSNFLISIIYLSYTVCIFGGVGTVVFHGEFDTEHLICAALLIACGIFLHIIAIATGTRQHLFRDGILLTMTLSSAIIFVVVLLMNNKVVRDQNLQPRDPSLKTRWWLSATSEYVLYLHVVILNSLVSERVLEHFAIYMQEEIKQKCMDHK